MYYGEKFNSISHLVGASLALVGGAVLITMAGMEGDVAKIASYSVYAVTLFLLYLSSTLYHSFPGRVKPFFRVLCSSLWRCKPGISKQVFSIKCSA